MIELRRGNLLEAEAEALVNTVNTVGVMGKGIALQFRQAFPENYEVYRRACREGRVSPGRMLVVEVVALTGPRLIINFPTKRHWRGRARMADIESGLRDLVDELRRRNVGSVAVPPLGCGNGGLLWSEVRPRIEAALGDLPDIRVMLYEPVGAPDPREQRVATRPPRMTPGRAALLGVLSTYAVDPSVRVTQLVAQKLAYLLQAAGQPLRLKFTRGRYGPYAENLNHVLQRMEGHFTHGYGDRTGESDLGIDPDALHDAWEWIERDADTERRIERVRAVIEGFESPLGLELLGSVLWVAGEDDGARGSADAARTHVSSWNERKGRLFSENHVRAAWDRLSEQGWFDSAPDRL